MKQQTEMENFMLRKGMFLADRYEILEQIGTGGMSDVYRAKCHKLNRFVAIKVLKKEYSEDKTFVSKFRAEAQAAAGLTHPNIVNVYDVGDENGIYYIVMLVRGVYNGNLEEADNSIAIVYMVFNVICLEFGVQKSRVDRLFKK